MKNVLLIASEAVPFIKTGGLADVAGSLPKYFSKNDAYDNNNGWYRCVKCGRSFRKGDMDIDHIIPQKYGGSDRETNLQCICKHCNRSKQASMKDTPKDLLRSSKRVAKRELSERKMIFDIARNKDDF